jgi:hypothetical protein
MKGKFPLLILTFSAAVSMIITSCSKLATPTTELDTVTTPTPIMTSTFSSLPPPTSPPNKANTTPFLPPTLVPPTPTITLNEAIDIAYGNVPASVVASSSLVIWWSLQGTWQMEFVTNISQKDLGWVNNPEGTPTVVLNDYFDTGIYNVLLININGQTGMIQLKMASNGPQTGDPGPPLTVVPPKAR